MAHYYVVYTKRISEKYKANLRSSVTVFLFFNAIFCFVLPFIFAYNSHGFWIKENSFREQPIVKFKYQYLIILEGQNANSHFTLICSTFDYLNLKNAVSDNCSMLKVIEKDENRDGKIDKMNMIVHITNISAYNVNAFHLILIFDYKLQEECILSMEAMATASYMFPQPVGKLDIVTELNTELKRPLSCHSKHVARNHSTVFTRIAEQKNKIDAIHQITTRYVENYMSINLKTLHYTKRYKSETADNEPLIITADIRYAEQEIIYKTRFWQLIKWAWIQYFSILALFIFLSRKIKKFVFQNRILQTIKMDSTENY